MFRKINPILAISIILIFAIIVGGVIFYLAFQQQPEQMPVKFQQEQGQKNSDLVGWKTHRNEEYGFEFRYPGDVEIIGNNFFYENIRDIALSVSFDKIENFLGPLGYDGETLKRDREALLRGDLSISIDFPLKESLKIIRIGNAIGRDFMVLGQFDTCDVRLTRTILIYKNDFVVDLTFIYSVSEHNFDKLVELNPSYFEIDELECGTDEIMAWKDRNLFYEDLINGKTDSTTQKWYKDSDQILSTFRFVE